MIDTWGSNYPHDNCINKNSLKRLIYNLYRTKTIDAGWDDSFLSGVDWTLQQIMEQMGIEVDEEK